MELNMNKIQKRIVRTISSYEALKDVEPYEAPQDVINKKKKIIVNSAERTNNTCVKLEISYM